MSHKIIALERIEELEKTVLLDSLTLLGTRRYIEMNLKSRMELLMRYGWPFAVLFITVDGFRDLTVAHGLEAGDLILKMVSRTLVSNVRPFDFIGRWEQHHFFAIIENVNESQLFSIANKLRILVEHSSLESGPARLSATISIGAHRALPQDSAEGLLEEAEAWFGGDATRKGNRVEILGIRRVRKER